VFHALFLAIEPAIWPAVLLGSLAAVTKGPWHCAKLIEWTLNATIDHGREIR
jgi:hypothetical protein